MKLGVMHEAKVLGEAGSNNGGTSGTADFPYAKVYINNNGGNAAAAPAPAPAAQAQAPVAQAPVAQAPVQAAPAPAAASNFCSSAKHSGQSVTNYSNTVSTIGDVGYELWADSGSNSATFYSDGSFSCSFQNAGDYLCRAGLSFDSTQSHQQIGHMYADFKLVKQNIANVDYSFVGVYGWTRQPLVEYYIVDNWLSQYRPADWVGDTKFGDFVIDGAEYTVYKNTRTGPSIDGDTTFTQYFSIRKEARDCGTIDISAHFAQWEKLGMKLGVMHEAKVLGEAGSNNGGTSGTADFPYAKVYINNNGGNAAAPAPAQAQAPAPAPAAPKYPKGNGFQFYTQCVNPKDWAMTYDDGPTEYADAILDLLKEKGVKATFFVLGKFYMDSSNPEWARIIKRMDSEGHIIGTHTFSHQDLTQLSYDQILDEMNKITDAVYKVIGKKPVFMRPPYGSGRGNQTVMGALQGLGYNAAVTWNVDPMDYSNGGDINYAVSAIKQTIGQPIITLNHLKYEGDSLNGILALAKAEIDTLLGAGYRSVTMEECLGMSAYE